MVPHPHAGLVNCTTIDWFTEWPADALHEVAAKQLAEENLGSEETKASMCKVFVTAHQSVSDMSRQMLQQLKRHNYVTPTNYLETVRGYRLARSCMAGGVFRQQRCRHMPAQLEYAKHK